MDKGVHMGTKSDLLFRWAASMLVLVVWAQVAWVMVPLGGMLSAIGWLIFSVSAVIALCSTAYVGHEYATAQ